jgi:hypothetical protein
LPPDPPALTVVVSTYGRPETLVCALSSLQRQTDPHWVAHVMGDACDERTEEAVRDLRDGRLWYCNLPHRTGDQSGPHSVGAALATTPLLAFLNQDDILLPDHLEHCTAALGASGADLCVGGAVTVRTSDWSRPGSVRAERPARPHLRDAAVLQDQAGFEPASSWVLRRAAHERVGPWRDGATLYRAPINDWLLRAAGSGLTTHHSPRVTVVRVSDHSQPGGQGYRTGAATQRVILERLDAAGPEALRDELGAAAERWSRFGQSSPVTRVMRATGGALAPAVVRLHHRFGFDPYALWCRARGRRRGWWKTWALRLRTGDTPLPLADRLALLAHARSQMARHPGTGG